VELVTTGVSGKRQSFAVYDIHGRLVRRAQVPAGAARVTWDGRDRDGRPAASGVYLIRVEDGSPRTAAKVAIVR
jgi:flagellar hook assembly protein FlgD